MAAGSVVADTSDIAAGLHIGVESGLVLGSVRPTLAKPVLAYFCFFVLPLKLLTKTYIYRLGLRHLL